MRLKADAIFETLDKTWPAARQFKLSAWTLREGKGGGKRVSAATASDFAEPQAIHQAESEMRRMGQTPLFMIRPEDNALDRALSDRGYEIVDPVTIYAIRCEEIAKRPAPAEAIESWPPLAIQKDIWNEGGVGPARIDVMERAQDPRVTILGRVGDRSAATVFLGMYQDIAMLHALETRQSLRRKGAGRLLMRAAAHWAALQGAEWLTLAVVTDNVPANTLYRVLGMEPVTTYHYRRAPEVSA